MTAHLPDPTPDPRRWKALGVLALVQFMLVLDITVVNVALPHIQVDLGFSRAGLAWVVDGYTLTAGGLLLLGGRLADVLGRRRMFFAGVGLFAVASVASGAASGSGLLVAARFVQGAGEALAAPAAFGLVALLFTDPQERTKAIGIFSGVAGLGGTLGPILSGLLITWLSWRWIFFINVPVAAFALLAVGRLVAESRADAPSAGAGAAPDWEGALLGTAGLVGVVYGLIEAANHPWGSGGVLLPLLAGVGVLAGFVLRERTAGAPLVPHGFFTNRTRVTANVVTLLFTSVFFTLFFLLTLYLQEVHRYSALRTGFAYLPVGVAIGVGIGVGTALIGRLGARPVLTAAFVLVAAGIGLMSRITVHGAYLSETFPALLVIGLGSGLCFVGFGNASVHGVSVQDASLASGVQNAVQQVGGAVGLAVLATVALRHAASGVRRGVDPAVASTAGFSLAYRISALVLLAGAVVAGVCLQPAPRTEPATPLTADRPPSGPRRAASPQP